MRLSATPAGLSVCGLVLAALGLAGCQGVPGSTTTAAPTTATSGASALGVTNVVLGVGADDRTRTVTWLATSGAASCVELNDALGRRQVIRGAARPASQPGRFAARADLAGLQPGAGYTYRVGDCAAAWTAAYRFRLPTGADTDFLFYGDPQVYDSPDEWGKTLQLSLTRVPTASFLLVAGDWVDGDSAEEQWAQWDMVLAPRQLAEVAVAPTLGNHDDAGGPTYAEHFATPNSGSTGATVPGSGDYWFRRGSVLLVNLNTNDLDAAAHGAFLDAAVAANPDARWQVVSFHQGPYSGDGHHADDDVVALRKELVPLLSRAGIDLVLNGHDHVYTRSLLIDGVELVPGSDGARLSPEAGQVLYVTANSASGTKFYPLTKDLPWVARSSQELIPTYTAVRATDADLRVTTRRISDDAVVDEVTLER